MFRPQANPMDESVGKATDENLTSENWEYILDVCDRVTASSSGPQQAIASLIKRLAHRNANVQLYTLELANALSQNCGPELHRELASKAFTDALLRLAGDRNTHAQVKQKVLERMGTWTELFGRNAELGIMEQAYHKLRTTQPGLLPPSKPVKREISNDDRRKEEDELQMALALSVKDKGLAAGSGGGNGNAPANATSRDDSEAQPPLQTQASGGAQGTTAATVSRVRALYDFTPSEPGELAFRKNDIIAVLESVYKDWWKGSLRGNTGIFPLNYVEKLQDPTKEEVERDAVMEAEVFGEIKNVEKLLALLSVRGDLGGGGGGGGRRNEGEEEEISELYQKTLAIRPKLIELIGKYSQKKDDFTQLNEKFIKARRDYEALLESSMSQSQPQYQQHYPVRPRQSSSQIYPPQQQQQQQQQQPPYGGGPSQQQQHPPPQAYPPHQNPASAQAYPPSHQQPFVPQQQQSQTHLPLQQQQQEPSRYYSPAPPSSDPPAPAQALQQQQQPPGYSLNISSPPNGAVAAAAPFHFIPGGIQANNPPQQQPPQHQEIRRKPSPQAPLSAGAAPDPYGTPQPPPFQGQIRPNSIHTLNSGNPQELATGGYESPVDNRHSYPTAPGAPMGLGPSVHGGAPQQVYDSYPPQPQPQHHAPPPQQQMQSQPSYDSFPPPQPQHAPPPQPQVQAPMPPRSDRDALPSRQRTHSFESPSSSVYSIQAASASQQDSGAGAAYPPLGQPPPQQPQQQVVPTSPSMAFGGQPQQQQQQQQGYQAYQAYQPQQQQRLPSGGSVGGGDPGEFYR